MFRSNDRSSEQACPAFVQDLDTAMSRGRVKLFLIAWIASCCGLPQAWAGLTWQVLELSEINLWRNRSETIVCLACFHRLSGPEMAGLEALLWCNAFHRLKVAASWRCLKQSELARATCWMPRLVYVAGQHQHTQLEPDQRSTKLMAKSPSRQTCTPPHGSFLGFGLTGIECEVSDGYTGIIQVDPQAPGCIGRCAGGPWQGGSVAAFPKLGLSWWIYHRNQTGMDSFFRDLGVFRRTLKSFRIEACQHIWQSFTIFGTFWISHGSYSQQKLFDFHYSSKFVTLHRRSSIITSHPLQVHKWHEMRTQMMYDDVTSLQTATFKICGMICLALSSY